MVTFNEVIKFDYLCSQVAYPFCVFFGSKNEPSCFSRNAEIGSRLFFQPATLMIYILALLMTSIMIHNIKVKYTAVGRKEI
ncbi:Chitin synthase, class 7, partial [Coelomomyces lativittatus]